MECTTGTCKTDQTESCPCGSGMSEGCCDCMSSPIETATKMWRVAFFDAMHQEQVKRLQKRINDNFGDTMDKAADAVVESFGKLWQSMLLGADAKQEIGTKLQKIYTEANRK